MSGMVFAFRDEVDVLFDVLHEIVDAHLREGGFHAACR
jgi:hypothetical protein